MPGGKPWRKDHDPGARPLGCNGKYGTSGAKRHRHRGEKACRKCLDSESHWQRERKRGAAPLKRPVNGCGTWQAAARHYLKDEPLDYACALARAEYRRNLPSRQPVKR